MEQNYKSTYESSKIALQNKWRNVHFKVMLVICLVMVLCETSTVFFIPSSNYIQCSLEQYVLKYCILPVILYSVTIISVFLLLKVNSFSIKTKNYIVTLSFAIECLILSFVHDQFLAVFASGTIAITLSIIYCDKILTLVTTALIIVGEIIIGFFCQFDAGIVKNDLYLINVTFLLILLAGTCFVSIVIIDWEEKRIRFMCKQQSQISKLVEEVAIDPLTGLQNRRSLRNYIDSQESSITFAMIDVDKFKPVNDTIGHDSGDKVLSSLGEIIRKHLTDNMTAFRYGGDEFLIASVNNSIPEVQNVCLRIFDEFNSILTPEVRALGTALSIGIATSRKNEAVTLTIKRADKALYSVKGRSPVKIKVSE